MKQEDWTYLQENWSSTDEAVLMRMADIRAAEVAEQAAIDAKLKEKEKEIDNLKAVNQNLNSTNISLALRLSDPTDPRNMLPDEDFEEDEIPDVNDYDAFMIND